MANLKFCSYIAAAGQEDLCSHVESITSTNRIISFPRGTETIIVYCPPPLFPLNDGISLLLLHFRGEKRKLRRESRERKRADTGQSSTAATSRWAADQTVRSNSRFLELCWNHVTIRAYTAAKRQHGQQCQPWHWEFTSRCTVSALFKLVKSWCMENGIKPPAFQARDFICHGTGSYT